MVSSYARPPHAARRRLRKRLLLRMASPHAQHAAEQEVRPALGPQATALGCVARAATMSYYDRSTSSAPAPLAWGIYFPGDRAWLCRYSLNVLLALTYTAPISTAVRMMLCLGPHNAITVR